MKRYTVRLLVLALVALLFLLCPQQFSESGSAAGQRRRTRRVARPPAKKPSIDYSKFLHATKAHQDACDTCHKTPTTNSQKVRGFPDVADFPGHDACVGCHRAQFFRGTQPIICSVCHTKTSPRDEARFSFRNSARPQQFTIKFPHDKHQDVIATLRSQPKFGQLVRASLVRFAHASQDNARKYNNCEICHVANTKAPVAPATGWSDGFIPNPATFKTAPDNHAACFNCHWRGQEPTRDNCKGCHEPAPIAYVPSTTPKRKSIKFEHDGGGDKKNHPAECTTCHINITKSTTLVSLKPDVPIYPSCAASSCHQPVITEELGKYNKAAGSFTCVKCHTSDVGSKKPPNSHVLAASGQ